MCVQIDLVPPAVVQEWVEFFRWRYPAIAHVVTFSSHFSMLSEADLKEIAGLKKTPQRLLKKAAAVGSDALMEVLSQIPLAGKSVNWAAGTRASRSS